ncbi:exopolygalacturonase-like [Cucumis melo]|uniref:Exopolygalacturonase-like n=1 Tax=Cucumis melo TaxID=3656 RepID=A0ABM3KU35_CUCME|nr:exopolygalacturonase-like [Cucumis melo]
MMGLRLNIMALLLHLSLMLASTAKGQSIFDITTYGAKPNTDITQTLANAWKDACTSTNPSKLLIPTGVYQLNQSILHGPCNSSIEVQMEGTLQAHPDPIGAGLVLFQYIDQLTVSGTGAFDGQGKGCKKNDTHLNKICNELPMNVRFSSITNSIVKDITSLDSNYFHINLLSCKNVTLQNVTIIASENSPNTDGVHVSRSEEINILNTQISTGADCVSVGGTNKQIVITNVTCGPGDGISIGSLGKYTKEREVTGVAVKSCKLINTWNGVRIKTWPDSASAYTASDLHFEDIEMVNVSNPIIINQEYCSSNQCNNKIPSKIKILNVSFKNIRGTSATSVAVKFICSKDLPCEGVEVADIDLAYNGVEGQTTSHCVNVIPIITGKQNPRACVEATPINPPSTTD